MKTRQVTARASQSRRWVASLCLLLLLVSASACYRVHSLGENTGKAFQEVLARQQVSRAKQKPMEGELAAVAGRRLIAPAPSAQLKSKRLRLTQ